MTYIDDYILEILLGEVPELRERYGALVQAWEGDAPDIPLVMEELVDLVTPWLTRLGTHEGALSRAFAAVEHVALIGDEGETAVAYGFLDALAPEALAHAMDFLGPCTTGILDALDDGTFEPDSELPHDEAG